MTYESSTESSRRMRRLNAAVGVYRYDNETGKFFNRTTGNEAGHPIADGSLILTFNFGKTASSVSATQLAWWCLTECDPNENGATIVHLDGDHENNHWSNLERQVGPRIDRKSYKNNKNSAYCGVCWDKKSKQFKSYYCTNGEKIHVGFFDTQAEAKIARDEAMSQYIKETYKNFKRTITEDDLK